MVDTEAIPERSWRLVLKGLGSTEAALLLTAVRVARENPCAYVPLDRIAHRAAVALEVSAAEARAGLNKLILRGVLPPPRRRAAADAHEPWGLFFGDLIHWTKCFMRGTPLRSRLAADWDPGAPLALLAIAEAIGD